MGLNFANDYPPDVLTVLSVVVAALKGKALTPERIQGAASPIALTLPGHRITMHYNPRSPKGTKPAIGASYALTIRGPRIDGNWYFNPQYLADYLKAEAVAFR